MGWLKRMIAWAVAGAELAELERWRVEWSETRRWLAEFKDAADALDHLERIAKGGQYDGLCNLRERMRGRRAALPGPLTTAFDAPRAARLTKAPILFSLETTPLVDLRSAAARDAETDWDVAEQHVRALDQVLRHIWDSVDRDPPTHFTGLTAPAPRRVEYKFLSPGCDARS